jgi:hypothetical protein
VFTGDRSYQARYYRGNGYDLWKDFNKIDEIHKTVEIMRPDPENNRKYEKLLPVFEYASECQANISDALRAIEH